jgi:hypothetical protein
MIKILLFALSFSSTVSAAKKPERGMCGNFAKNFAMVVANLEYPKNSQQTKAPFKVIDVKESTDSYFLESGYNKQKIAEMQKTDPVEIYGVALKSSDNWECMYYVTVMVPVDFIAPEEQKQCRFKSISAHHCAK